MNANERFELMADEFYKKTGMLAPGKDSPTGFYVDSEKLASEWFKFCTEYSDRVFSAHYEMIEMLENINCFLSEDGLQTNGLAKEIAKIPELIEKVRGEHE